MEETGGKNLNDEKKKKLSVKKLVSILVIAVVVVAAVTTGVVLAMRDTDKIKYVKAEEAFDFTNLDPVRAAADDGFVLDGVFDESVYEDLDWLYLHRANGEALVDVAMTSYYGERGIYFAFDNTETTSIYVNPKRASYINSGLELYLAPYGVTTINDENTFEIDLLPTGEVDFKKRAGDGKFVSAASTNDIMAWMGTTTKGGEVNTEECYGYTMEFFIPWDYLDYLGLDTAMMKENPLWVNLAHITSYNYAGTDLAADRYWYSFATQKGSEGWNNVTSYFRFNKDGVMDTVPVSLVEGEHYTITGSKRVIPHMKAYVTITPEEGYAISSILCNDEEQIRKVSYNKDGSVTAAFQGPEEETGLTISAAAEKVTAGNKSINGQVSIQKLGENDTAEGLWIACIGPKGETSITPDADGGFALKDLEQGFYTIQAEKEGYYPVSKGIFLNRDVDTDIDLEFEMFIPDINTCWDIEKQNELELYQWGDYGTILSANSYDNFSIEANFRYDPRMAEGAKDDLHTQQRTGYRIKFSDGTYWHPDLIDDNGVVRLQYGKLMGDNSLFEWNTVYELTESEAAKYRSEEGIRFKLMREGQHAVLYLDDKLVRVEDLGKECKDCTAQVGFESYSAASYTMKYDFTDTGVKIPDELLHTTDLAKGRIVLPTGGFGEFLLPGKYVDMDLTLKAMDHPDGTGDPRTDVMLTFANGKIVSFGVATDSYGNIILQSLDNGEKGINPWAFYGELTKEEVKRYKTTAGIRFRVVRKGTSVYLFVDGRSVSEVDLSEYIKADTEMTVTIRHWDDMGAWIDIPFSFNHESLPFLFGYGWDFGRQEHGVVATTPVQDNDMMSARLSERYGDFDMTLGAYNTEYPTSNRIDLLFDFGKERISFGMVCNDDGSVMVQSTDQTLQPWAVYGSLTDKELGRFQAKPGVNFRVVRKGTAFYLLVDERLVKKVDLSGNIDGGALAVVTLRYWGKGGVTHEIPFSLSSTVTDQTVASLEDRISKWDTSKFDEGLLVLTNGGRADYTFSGSYTDLDMAVMAQNHPDGSGDPRTDVLLEFDNGKAISFGVATDSYGNIILQSLDNGENGINPWAFYGELTKEEVEQYQTTSGVQLRIVRDGVQVYLYIGNRFVNTVDLSQWISKDTGAVVTLRHWDDDGARIEFPFTMKKELPLFLAGLGFDVSRQEEGILTAAPDGMATAFLAKQYTDADMTIKVSNTGYPKESRTDLAFDFGNQGISFGVVTQNDRVFLQSMDHTENPLRPWTEFGQLTEAETEKYKTAEGVAFRVVRKGAVFYLLVDERLVNKVDLSGELKADMPASLTLRFWGENEKHEIPFRFASTVTDSVVAALEDQISKWDASKLDEGLLVLTRGGYEQYPFAGTYTELDMTVNALDHPDGAGDPRTDVLLEFDNGKAISFGVVADSYGNIILQSLDNGENGINPWASYGELTEEEGKMYRTTKGVSLRIVRSGTKVYLFVGSRLVNTVDLSQWISKDTKARITLRHWGDEGARIEFPFTMKKELPLFLSGFGFDVSRQEQGVITAAPDGMSTAFLTKQYVDLDMTVRAYNTSYPEEGRTDLAFDFGNQGISFSVVTQDGRVFLQSMDHTDNPLRPWTDFGELTPEEVERYKTEEGVSFRVLRKGAVFYLLIDDRLVSRADLSEEIKGDTSAAVTLRYWGDGKAAHEIPFSLSSTVADAVVAELEDRISKWDTSKLDEGLLVLTRGGYEQYAFAGTYTDLDMTVNALDHPDGTGDPRTDVLLEFDNGKAISFGIAAAPDGRIILQSLDNGENGINPWVSYGELTEEEERTYRTTGGISLRIVRGGTDVYLYIGSRQIGTVDLSQWISRDSSVEVTLRHWGDEGARIEFPFALKREIPIFLSASGFDVSRLEEGIVTAVPDGKAEVSMTKKYADFDMTVKAYNTNYPNESRTDLAFGFGDKSISFCVVTQNNRVFLQAMDPEPNPLHKWKEFGDLTSEEAERYKTTEGVDFRVLRKGAVFYLMIDGRLVNKVDLSAEIAADVAASVTLRYWGETGVAHEIPFTFRNSAADTEVTLKVTGYRLGKEISLAGKEIGFESLGERVNAVVGNDGRVTVRLPLGNSRIVADGYADAVIQVTESGKVADQKLNYKVFEENSPWDLRFQNDGKVILPNNHGDHDVLPFTDMMTDMDLTMKAMDHPDGTGEVRMDVLMQFDNGTQMSFGILGITTPIIQSTGDGLSDEWESYGELTQEETAQYRTTAGIQFRVVRKGTSFELYIGDRKVNTVDLSSRIGADTKMKVSIRHWQDMGAEIDIPFLLKEQEETAGIAAAVRVVGNDLEKDYGYTAKARQLITVWCNEITKKRLLAQY